MKDRLKNLIEQATAEVSAASERSVLEELKWRYIGRKGELTSILRELGRLPADQRPEAGRLANEARVTIEQAIAARALSLEAVRDAQESTRIDITLPGRRFELGLRHPLQAVREELESIFVAMGFSIAEGPEMEDEEHNFEALNILRDHPARDMQDTFYIADGIVLRTHTSPIQIRYMRAHAPRLPVRIIAPGPVYRRDDDVTHSPMFSQIEGLVVDTGITLGNLKGVLDEFVRRMFGSTVRTRFRPSYFPFTEPSNEIDISCTICGGDGCRICKGTGWIEILGAGMVHPQVLRNGGYDPDEVTGFAFGLGIERVAMLRHGIEDVRLLFDNDVRFLRQIGGVV